jgi:HK97 family phage prohead protease
MFQDSKFFFGYASVFDTVDLNGDFILQNSFKWNKNIQIPLLLEHDPKKKVGKITQIIQNDKGIFVEGLIFKEFAKKQIKLSVGYIVNESQKDGNVRILSSLALIEVSVVKKPANKLSVAICM